MRKQAIPIIVLLLVLGLATNVAQTTKDALDQPYDPERKWSVEELKEDLVVLRASLEEGHAGLYRYSTKTEMDGLFDAAARALAKPLTELEFMRCAAPLIAAVRCGHTRYRFSQAFAAGMERRPVYFPLGLKFIGRKAHLLRNLSDNPDLPLGGEVLSINGLAMSEIIDRMLAIMPSDGRIETAKFRRMEVPGSFSVFYTILFGLTETYAIEVRPPGEKAVKNMAVAGIAFADIRRRFEERYPDLAKAPPPISFEDRNGIPVLTIRTFGGQGYTQAKISYPDFLVKAFTELNERNARSLIIDLRDNGGGDDAFGKILFAHLIDEPFQYYAALETKKTEFEFLRYTDVPPERQKQPQGFLKENARGWYDVIAHPNVGPQKPIAPVFKGKVCVLINGGSFSASGETTSPMHYHKKAVFVGEECGAGYYGNNSGAMPTVTLPHTKIRVSVPLVRYTMAVDGYPKDRGIIPEYPVEPKIEDLLANRDTVLEFALALAAK